MLANLDPEIVLDGLLRAIPFGSHGGEASVEQTARVFLRDLLISNLGQSEAVRFVGRQGVIGERSLPLCSSALKRDN
jgi:hypothetical protein